MKMEALTSFMKDIPEVKNVYHDQPELRARPAGQPLLQGHDGAQAARREDRRRRPAPTGPGEGLAPFIAKIKASGADSIVTGNWGQDLTLLVKAANDAGLKAAFYTYYAGVSGTPTALAAGVGGPVRAVSIIHNGMSSIAKFQEDYKKRFNDDWYTGQTTTASRCWPPAWLPPRAWIRWPCQGHERHQVHGLQRRGRDAQDRPPVAAEHGDQRVAQGQAKVGYSVENTGFNFQEVKAIPAYVASTPTSCQMKRP